MDELVQRYLVLGLRLGRHIDGFVDAYYGPPELAEQADLVDPAELAAEAAALGARADSAYLRAQLLGCETTARRLAGERIGWAEEVERCYGVAPARTDEAVFERAHARLEEVLPGAGGLAARYQSWLEGLVLPPGRLLETATRFADALRARTAELFGLPEGEQVEVETVVDEPWSAFNYYLGGRRSRVVVNTDLPVHASRLPELVAHEIYPGHHTEHVWKEALLVDGEGDATETIFLVATPQATISEGIASLAPEIVGADAVAQELYDELGIAYDGERVAAVHDARTALEGVAVNAAFLLHEDGASRGDVVEYIERWSLQPRANAEKRVDFVTHPTWRAYISSYTSGYALCKQWVDGDTSRFRRLLTEQLTTGELSAA